jgi:hypothetical protein
MVQQNVDEMISLEEAQDEQQLDAEELAQELAMSVVISTGRSPPISSLLRVYRRSVPNWPVS